MKQVMVQYPEIEKFLTSNPQLAPASPAKLIAFCQDKQKNVFLRLELAAIVDWGEHFVKATYNLEGDGPLVLQCYEVVDSLVAAIRLAHACSQCHSYYSEIIWSNPWRYYSTITSVCK